MANYVFGPVPSRRLGRSLGVDLVPLKTCSYDCIYCQLGRTTCKTVERKEWVELDTVVRQLERKLDTGPDYITLSGSGEPTLFSRLDDAIARIKAITDIPVAVLTNGSLLWQDEVRQELAAADLVVPSLDAGDATMFRLINRPHEMISFEEMLDGLIACRGQFRGEYWLEVVVVGGYNVLEPELENLRACIERIRPDRVQLNTVTRPPAEQYASRVPPERLQAIAATFSPPAEVIAEFHRVESARATAGREEILELLRRRPCSVDDIADGLGIHRTEAIKHLELLSGEELVETTSVDGRLYYKLVAAPSEPKDPWA